ncbi:MAG: thioredoxin-dependent thiol peroxidase [Acidobacteria bacterium]|nr:thioredoxin-dependent thiol peroxidase [Acidobacteriota bacterium]
MLKEGDKAPDFSLQDDTGREVSLKDLRGKKVVLYFYPKDDTPGCTREACGFRDRLADFARANAVIYGVSKDSLDSHQAFKNKYSLPFALLSDPELKVTKAYGAWGEKNLYGKKTHGIIRSTFVIDEKGKIEKAYTNVKVDGHAEALLEHFST